MVEIPNANITLFIDGAEDAEGLLAKLSGIVEPHVPVDGLDLGDVVTVEGESEQVQVLLDPLLVGRLWDHRAASLHIPPQDHLEFG